MLAKSVQTLSLVDLGRMTYHDAWQLQRRLVAERSQGLCADTLLIVEHPPTITLGRSADPANIRVAAAELARRGIVVVESDRGGDVTYHAPGQIVGYPILKLARHGGDLGRYLRGIEQCIIQTVGAYGIAAERVPGLTGVWVGAAKICAIGVKLSASGVTSHGFALNVSTDLAGFDQIVPCGIQGCGVTSLAQLLGSAPPHADVLQFLLAAFATVFGVEVVPSQSTIDGTR
ncbi:lipoyl(octanoyl) transferase LipB [Candidatus Gracilibacteria bacterium]|nr:lipoyl(octanoyl) transferase LipB [Candidatus Gracilibacteria bacterium]